MFTRFGHVLPMLLIVLLPAGVGAQVRSMAQDPALDNLRHPPGVTTGAFGTLGAMCKLGEGPRKMILIPGLGFGDGIWTEFMERHKADSTMYAITLPGFGNTAPLPMPAEGSPFGDTPWTRSTIRAIEALRSLRPPTLLLCDNDALHPTEVSDLYAANIAGCTVVPATSPDVSAFIGEFCDRCTAPPN